MTEPNPADVLAPCPFCGGDVTIENRGDGDLFVILCEEGSPCIGSGFANFGMRSKKAQAIAAWNTRAGQQAQPTPDALREENERLCEAALEAVQRLAHTPMELCITAWSDISRPILEVIRRLPTQSDALLDAEGVKLYWYRQGKDDGVEHERAKIVAWLMREEDDYPSGKYSGFAAIIREEIEAGEHLK